MHLTEATMKDGIYNYRVILDTEKMQFSVIRTWHENVEGYGLKKRSKTILKCDTMQEAMYELARRSRF